MARGGPPRGPGRPQEEIDLEQMLRDLGGFLNRIFGGRGSGERREGPRRGQFWWLIPILGVLAVVWVATGVYQVNPGEQGVVRLFGRESGRAGPGIHWYWPAPIGKRNVIQVEKERAMELGFRTVRGQAQPFPLEALMVTGDINLVDVHLVVRYRIGDLRSYLFKVEDPEGFPDQRTLRDAAEAALREVVGQRPIDDVLVEDKPGVQNDTQVLLQRWLDDYGTGISVTGVELQLVNPPEPVIAAFNDVNAAREDKERLIRQAQGYQEDLLPKARGEAEKMLREAEAFREQRIRQAQGDAERFLAILKEYRKAKDVTRTRLYLETMEEVLPTIRKFIIAPQAGGNLLQFLSLEEATTLPPAPPVAPESK